MDSVENIRRVRHFTRTYIELTIHPRRRTQRKRRHGEACASSRYNIGKKGLFYHRCHTLKHRMNIILQLFFENYVLRNALKTGRRMSNRHQCAANKNKGE